MAKNPFTQIIVETPATNTFDLSHDNKLSLDMGKLYPVLVAETLPGDKWNISAESLIRMAPMTFPIMHRLDVTIHFFYVPKRICWENFPKYLEGEEIHPPYLSGLPDLTQTFPVEVGSLPDYMGLPTTTNMLERISAIPFLAYARIYNEYYQDQNNDSGYKPLRDLLQGFLTKNGRLAPSDFEPLATEYNFPIYKRAWEHDYFTSPLPFAQKGPAVRIPITLNDLPVEVYEALQFASGLPAIDGDVKTNTGLIATDDGVTSEFIKFTGLASANDATIEGNINQLRVSYALQRFYETNARSGTRYNELIKARWDVNIGDDRISRPEYIGGVKNNIVISEVLQTSSTSTESALGQYAGHGSAMLSGNRISYYCPEAGYIMGIMSILPKTAYFQGIHRHWQRFSILDEYNPEFAHIGEQPVKNKELYYDNALTDNNDEFGYMPYGSELKYIPSGVHGQFRTTMLDWHLARKFDTRPTLSEDFIYCNDDKRIFAVTDPDINSFFAHVYFDITAKRKIPYYSIPQ